MSQAPAPTRPSRPPRPSTEAGAAQHPGPAAGALIRRGADLVLLTEELYVRLFRLACGFLLATCPIALWFAGGGGRAPVTWVLATAGIAFALAGILRPRTVYGWLRRTIVRQMLPAAAGAVAMLLTGPDSPSWWVALGLLLLTTTLTSTRLALALAAVSSATYLGGTALAGVRLIGHGDAGVLAGGVGLIAYTVVGCFLVEAFARFVVGLHRLEHDVAGRREAPLRVPSVDAAPGDAANAQRPQAPAPARARSSVLTIRQLEAALLARDGLKQPEIAACMGISARQVERLLADARKRAGAGTTSHLVAMLIADGLAP